MKLVILSGEIAAGKTTLAKGLERDFGFCHIKTRDILMEEIQRTRVGVMGNITRIDLQKTGETLDRQSGGGRWVVPYVLEEMYAGVNVVLDSVRRTEQVEALRNDGRLIERGVSIIHIHLEASPEQLELRFDARGDRDDYRQVKNDPTEKEVVSMRDTADLVIKTDRCTKEDTLVRALAALDIRKNVDARLVDVLVGAQYGSEGKGHVVAHIAGEYDALMRVGGANAGHTVIRPDGVKYAFKLLPSGTFHRKPGAHIILGPGMNISLDVLLQEIEDCGLTPMDLSIDPNAWVVEDVDVEDEEGVRKTIGSTKQGVGRATARRINSRGIPQLDTRAVHYEKLRPYIRPTIKVLERIYSQGKSVLLEGTQGTGLSLYHGPYPYVTSRCTTAQGTMAEAGIPASRIRKTILVVRTNPIRVASPDGGTSGPMAQELTWEEVSKRANVPADVLRERERTTTTKRLRRIAEFDWSLLLNSVTLNGPTDIALTFTDYIDHKNADARRFEQLSSDTIRFIQEIERVAACPVSLITTRFHQRSIIDRRSW